MTIPKKLTIVFTSFYLIIIIYILLFLFVPEIQHSIVQIRENLTVITEGKNYYWALLISLGICFLGSASIGFPVPFPFVIFSLSNSILDRYIAKGLTLNQTLGLGGFWVEIIGITLVGGFGSVLGELTGYTVGYGTKRIAEERHSELLNNVDGFGKLVLENQKRTPIYVFLFALTPLPDDILFIPLGMIKYPFWKCIVPGWLGKSFTILFYCCWPIFIALGFTAQGVQSNSISSIITEAVLLFLTLSVMFFIMAFDWSKLLEKRKQKKQSRIENS